MAPQPLIVIVGETASGKSSLAIDMALKFNGEIISADSWAVRRQLNIGTAKPSLDEQKRIKHHLIDVVEPCEEFTAALYKRLASDAIKEISARKKLPIMVGGSGLYIDGVIFDYSFLKAGDREKREDLNKLTIKELLNKIKKAGYSMEGIDTRNKRRLIRLIETKGARPKQQNLRPNTLVIGIKNERETLIKKITLRTEAMFKQGLEKEVRDLCDEYGWQCEGLKGIGYIEWREYFEGKQDLNQTKQKIIKSTLDLSKRQRTWFKRNKSIQWVKTADQAVEIATTFLNKK